MRRHSVERFYSEEKETHCGLLNNFDLLDKTISFKEGNNDYVAQLSHFTNEKLSELAVYISSTKEPIMIKGDFRVLEKTNILIPSFLLVIAKSKFKRLGF